MNPASARRDAAIADLRALAQAFPDDSENWIALGDAYRDQNNFEAAIDAYDHAEKADRHAGQARLAAFLCPRHGGGFSRSIGTRPRPTSTSR